MCSWRAFFLLNPRQQIAGWNDAASKGIEIQEGMSWYLVTIPVFNVENAENTKNLMSVSWLEEAVLVDRMGDFFFLTSYIFKLQKLIFWPTQSLWLVQLDKDSHTGIQAAVEEILQKEEEDNFASGLIMNLKSRCDDISQGDYLGEFCFGI